PFGHRLAAEAAALVQPTLGVRGVAFGIATRNEIDRECSRSAILEQRRGGTVADMLCGFLCVVIGSEAPRPCQGCPVGDDRPVVAAAVVLEDEELQRLRYAHFTGSARE